MDMQLVHTVMEGGGVSQYKPGLVNESKNQLVAYKEAKAEIVNAFTLEYVWDLLSMTRGNVSEAARISGLSRVALQKILARMGENAATFRPHGASQAP